jgi:hypothetical protein
MDETQSSQYLLWVKLANDRSQSEQARQHYRALMEESLHQQLREAFRLVRLKDTRRA